MKPLHGFFLPDVFSFCRTAAVSSPLPSLPVPAQTDSLTELQVSPHWKCMDFVSDLHLQACNRNWHAFLHYLRETPADAIVLLGDIFEIWPGDDVLLDPSREFERCTVAALQQASGSRALYFMHGNRDFLAGADFCRSAGLRLLHDPCLLSLPGRAHGILLSHGDALCIDDVQYMQFRAMARHPAWQAALLQKPLSERLQLASQMRQQSMARKDATGMEGYADVDTTAAMQWLIRSGSHTLLHGHTHRPGEYALPDGYRRLVLSDWELDATPPRADVLRLHLGKEEATTWQRLGPADFSCPCDATSLGAP